MTKVYFSETLGRRAFAGKILEAFREPLEKAQKIFVKPNIVSYEPYPTTTHPEVLDAVLGGLAGHDVVVGDAPAVDAGRSKKILEKSPLRDICSSHGVSLVNLYSEKMTSIEGDRGYRLRMSALPLGCDLVISLPVLKVHFMCGLSGALKNQFGYLSRTDRILMHSKIKNIDKGIAELNKAVPTSLFIMDAVKTMVNAQECRHGGCPTALGAMLGGADPVSLDCYGLQLLEKVDLNIEETKRKCLKYIDYASEIGVGSKDFEIVRF